MRAHYGETNAKCDRSSAGCGSCPLDDLNAPVARSQPMRADQVRLRETRGSRGAVRWLQQRWSRRGVCKAIWWQKSTSTLDLGPAYRVGRHEVPHTPVPDARSCSEPFGRG